MSNLFCKKDVETLAQVFSCEFGEFLRHVFTEHLRRLLLIIPYSRQKGREIKKQGMIQVELQDVIEKYSTVLYFQCSQMSNYGEGRG